MRTKAFTVLELVVVMAMIALLGVLWVPALARTQPNTRSVRCMNNHRLLINAWRMYSEDNSDKVVYNTGIQGTESSVSSGAYWTWANNIMDWTTRSMNTNSSLLEVGPIARYLNRKVDVYKCPSDNFLSGPQLASGWSARTRSVSMNAYFGPYSLDLRDATWNGWNHFDTGYRQWLKIGLVTRPVSTWVLIDEQADSISDGYFLNTSQPYGYWSDIPGSYHNGGTSITYTDGHTEPHQWLSRTTRIPVTTQGWSPPSFDGLGRADYKWLFDRSTVKVGDY